MYNVARLSQWTASQEGGCTWDLKYGSSRTHKCKNHGMIKLSMVIEFKYILLLALISKLSTGWPMRFSQNSFYGSSKVRTEREGGERKCVPCVTRSLHSFQKAGLMWCAVLLFVNSGTSYYLFNVRLFVCNILSHPIL